MSATPQSPAITAAADAIRKVRYLMFTHTDEEVAQLAVRAYDDHIRQARAAKPRRSRRSKPPQRKAAAKVKG